MKILVLTSVYPQHDDGEFIVTPTVQYFCEKWAESGHEVLVIHNKSCFPLFFYWIPRKIMLTLSSKMGFNFPTKDSRTAIHFQKKNLNVYRLPMIKIIPHGKFSKNVINRQLSKIKKIASEINFTPEIIVSHWLNPQIELITKLGEYYRAKTSLVFHDDCSPSNIERFNLRNEIKKLGAVGCRSEAYAKYVKSELDLDRMPFVCYSGVPDNLAKDAERELTHREFHNKLIYLYVGRLVKFKNIDVIIKALHKYYGNNPFEFHIIGTGAEKEALVALSQHYGMEKSVIFHGQLPREEVFDLMKSATYFVMVSKHETFGMVYLEAMLAGCVTIAGKNGGIDGVIIDGENGFLSAEGNVEELTSTFSRISAMDDSKLINLRQQAMRTAISYSDQNVAKKYIEEIRNWKK